MSTMFVALRGRVGGGGVAVGLRDVVVVGVDDGFDGGCWVDCLDGDFASAVDGVGVAVVVDVDEDWFLFGDENDDGTDVFLFVMFAEGELEVEVPDAEADVEAEGSRLASLVLRVRGMVKLWLCR